MTITINKLKKGDLFIFNDTTYEVKQKYSNWKKNDEPYLLTRCGQIFYYDELEVILKTKQDENN